MITLWASSALAWDGAPSCAYDEVYPGADPESYWANEAMCQTFEPTIRQELSEEDAAQALEGPHPSPHQHALDLATVAEVHPNLSDWVAVRRGYELLEAGDSSSAEQAFADALNTVDSDVRVQARVGRVRSLLAQDDRGAEDEVRRLRNRYPELPEYPAIQLEVAAYNERRGDDGDAASLYRHLDVYSPGTAEAAEARRRLISMIERGVAVRPMAPIEQVTRAERLFWRGPLSEARLALAALEESPPTNTTLRAKAFALMAKLARHEGRFADATRYFRLSTRAGAYGDAEDIERRLGRAADVAEALNGNQETARARLARLRGRRPLSRLPSPRLVSMVSMAARADLPETLDAILTVLKRRTLSPTHRLSVVLHASGIGNGNSLLRILGDVPSRAGSMGTRARYFEARLLQTVGRLAEAEEAFLDVIRRDRSEMGWYAMWSEQELRTTRGQMIGACTTEAECVAVIPDISEPPALTEGRATDANAPAERDPAVFDAEAIAARFDVLLGDEDVAEGYPWVGRAAALVRLGETEEAGRQLYEAYLAWREASGRAIRRCGLESVAMGKSRARRPVAFAIRAKRQRLTSAQRTELAQLSAALGEAGAAAGFGGWDAVAARPRAYQDLVEAAAARYALDPNLLFAIMRVESVYQANIVSYAGAIGLAQIMPRTGTMIAHELHVEDFKTSMLLDPEVNLEFAAWYLRSLLDRWDGHVALAIASYNGGPHNVRRWLRDYGHDLPLDAFLEHIPFTQTHRYVRRVLGHYQEYREQVGLPMIAIDDSLPSPSVDPVGF